MGTKCPFFPFHYSKGGGKKKKKPVLGPGKKEEKRPPIFCPEAAPAKQIEKKQEIEERWG